MRTLTGHQDAVRTVITDGKQIISAGEDRTIKIWNLQGQLLATLERHNSPIKAIAISPHHQYLASVDDRGRIILWQRHNQTWQQLQTFQGVNNSLWSVAFSPDSTVLATVGEDTKVILWNLTTMLPLNPLAYGCAWIKDYLHHSLEIKSANRHLCN